MNPRAVIADDEPLMREQLRARLGEVWPELEIAAEARNGAEALEQITAQNPDLVFLDIRMPGLDGIEVLRQARLLVPCLAVLMISTSAAGADVARALDGGACGYLIKPFRHEDVLHSLASVMAARGQPAVRELRSP